MELRSVELSVGTALERPAWTVYHHLVISEVHFDDGGPCSNSQMWLFLETSLFAHLSFLYILVASLVPRHRWQAMLMKIISKYNKWVFHHFPGPELLRMLWHRPPYFSRLEFLIQNPHWRYTILAVSLRRWLCYPGHVKVVVAYIYLLYQITNPFHLTRIPNTAHTRYIHAGMQTSRFWSMALGLHHLSTSIPCSKRYPRTARCNYP